MKKQFLKITMTLCLAGMVFLMRGGTAKAVTVYETEDNGSYDAANVINTGTTISGNLSSGDDKDYYKITPSSNGKISLSFNHTFQDSYARWNIKTYVYEGGEYNELSNISVALNDNEKIRIPAIGAKKNGSYYIVVEGGGDVSGVNYSIDVSLDATENYEKEVNDVYGTATDITLNTSMSGNLASGSDKDYYKMVAGADGKISLTFNHVNQNSYSAWKIRTYLYSNGEYTEQSYTYVALKDNEKVNIPAIGAVKDGIYYIVVEEGSSGDEQGEEYKIDTVFEAVTYEKENNDTYGTATAITENQKISGNISGSGDLDYYKFVAGASDSYTISFMHTYEENYASWKITVYNETNGEYKELNSKSVSLKDSAMINLPSVGMNQNGIYYIKVESSSDIEGKDYSLLISQGVKKNTDNTTQNQNKTNDQKKNDQSEKGTSLKKGYLYSYCTTGKRSLKLYWSTVSGASGYQIRYSRSKSMSWNVKTKKVSGQSSEQKIITKLSRRKVYYVQIRAYKKLNGKLVYGKWSAKKKLKTK